MDYKELIEELKSILPEKVLYGDLIGAEGVYAHSGPMVYADPEPYFIEQAITAITDLLSRAAAAEARAEKAERERDVATNRMKDIISKVLSVPAADVEPVVHGKWLEIEEIYGDIRWKCSACGIEWCFIEGTPEENGTHYCPNCGAKMTEE